MIWKRLKKTTHEEEEAFRDRMTEEKLPFSEKAIMVLTAYGVFILPCLLVLLGLSALTMWLFGML